LADVLAQVVQFEPPVLEKLEQLPVPAADRPGRQCPPPDSRAQIARKMPVNRLTIELLAPAGCEQPQITHAVKRLTGRPIRPGQLQQRRVQVDTVDRLVAGRAARNTPGPAEDVRHAYAALVQHPLAAPQRCVVRRLAVPDALALVPAYAAVV